MSLHLGHIQLTNHHFRIMPLHGAVTGDGNTAAHLHPQQHIIVFLHILHLRRNAAAANEVGDVLIALLACLAAQLDKPLLPQIIHGQIGLIRQGMIFIEHDAGVELLHIHRHQIGLIKQGKAVGADNVQLSLIEPLRQFAQRKPLHGQADTAVVALKGLHHRRE